jgi:hypothetical protein
VQNPNLVPPFLHIDLADIHNLWSLFLLTQQLRENVDNITMIADSEAYQTALVFYNSVKMAARQDISGAKAIYEELKKHFSRYKHRSADEDIPEIKADSEKVETGS